MSYLSEERQKGGQAGSGDGQCLGQPKGANVGHLGGRPLEPSVRKYLVLLQDCLAVKFVRLGPFPPVSASHANPTASSPSYKMEDLPGSGSKAAGYGTLTRPHSSASSVHPSKAQMDSGTQQVDHSLHGILLYKGFRDANLQCYWNTSLYEAFRHLEYRGYVVPSTVLIWALPRFLSTLRTAWSRQMLRSPPGYRIEFIGEIEELIADPVQQSQFAPLSDSLCWAILEITALGEEAFVDSILSALTSAFPSMAIPSRELVYSTLEKLIRERKVYTTSCGYFVVTPDTFRYMSGSGPGFRPEAAFSSNNLPLDALMTSPTNNNDGEEKLSFSRNSWDSTASAENPVSQRDLPEPAENQPQLRRHNSLKIIRQRDKENVQSPSKTLGRRSLSFRLYKSKSIPNSVVGGKDSNGRDRETDIIGPDEPKPKSGKSFFRKLFKRSSSKKGTTSIDSAPPITPPAGPGPSPKAKAPSTSAATQTPPDQPEPGPEPEPRLDYSHDAWDTDPPKSRPDDGPLYATLSPVSPTLAPGPHSLFSSRCSTLSRGTSLGYGSQGQGSLGFQSTSPTPSQSPSASKPPNLLPPRSSSNANSYRSYYDFYRRRYPSYGSSALQSRPPTPSCPGTGGSYRQRPSSHSYETIPDKKGHQPAFCPPGPQTQPAPTPPPDKQPSTMTNEPFLSSTTVKSTTNMELQFRLPMGKLGNFTRGTTGGGGSSRKVNGSPSTNVKLQQPSSEVTTTVSSNGRIETHFDCSDQTNVEIQLGPTSKSQVTVSGQRSKPAQPQPLKSYRKISDIGLFRNGNNYPPVRVTDITKDSDEEFM